MQQIFNVYQDKFIKCMIQHKNLEMFGCLEIHLLKIGNMNVTY